jgi:Domain of unknown function (DUF4112)
VDRACSRKPNGDKRSEERPLQRLAANVHKDRRILVANVVSTFGIDGANPVRSELIDPRLADVEAIARWMDYAFVLPGGFRFGFAGFIGLIPGLGDVMDALISLYIVNRALQLGIPRVGVARMVLNVAIEGLLGAAPFVGDLFDVVFKANRRNYVLLNSYLAQPQRQRGMDWLFLLATLLFVIAGVALPIWFLSLLIRRLV